MARQQTTLRLTSSEADIALAGTLIRAGQLVAMPTETVYGLAGNALDDAAVQSIFAAKERPGWDPLIVHIADEAMLSEITLPLEPVARRLAKTFWPGPLTLLLPRTSAVPDAVTAGRSLVGVRMPAHPVALSLIRAAGVPLAAPSANRFGHVSPTTAEHVCEELDGRIAAVIDAGPCAIGVESTVLDPATNPVTIYRHGGVSAAEITAATGSHAQTFVPGGDLQPASLPSPGVGIRHYAPSARLVLVQDEDELYDTSSRFVSQKTGVLLPLGWRAPANVQVFPWGQWDDPGQLAHRLYKGLRTLDHAGVTVVVCPLPRPGEDSLREALRDRLRKAAMPKA